MTGPAAIATEVRPNSHRIDSWDVLRGVAVGLVLLRHAWPGLFAGAGVTGVTMFFGLSGFLITDIIQAEVRRTGRLSIGKFYLNRAFRLLPAVIVLLLVYVSVELLTGRMGDTDPFLSLVVGLTYVTNAPGIHLGPGLGHLWTLAVEEQFYLIWPFLMIFAIRRSKIGTVILAVLIGALVLTAAALVIAPAPGAVYTLPTSWAPALVIGAAARLYLDNIRRIVDMRWLQILAGIVLVGFCFVPEAKGLPITYLLFGPIIAACVAILVAGGIRYPEVPRVLHPIRFLGRISYGTYLWNFVIVCWLSGTTEGGTLPILGITLTLAAAIASWYLIEQPAQKLKKMLLKHHAERRRRTGVA